jgi:hypothetical protein
MAPLMRAGTGSRPGMRLGELLVKAGVLAEPNLEQALAISEREGTKLGSTLIKLGFVDAPTVTRALAKLLGVTPVGPEDLAKIELDAIALITPELAHRRQALPIRFLNAPGAAKELLVSFVTPQKLDAIDELSFITNARVFPGVSPESLLLDTLDRHYPMPKLRAARMVALPKEEPSSKSGTAITAQPRDARSAATWLVDSKAALEVHEDGCVLLVDDAEWLHFPAHQPICDVVSDYIRMAHDRSGQLTVRSKIDRGLFAHFPRRGRANGQPLHLPPGETPGKKDENFPGAMKSYSSGGGLGTTTITIVAAQPGQVAPPGAVPIPVAVVPVPTAPPPAESAPPSTARPRIVSTISVVAGNPILDEPPRPRADSTVPRPRTPSSVVPVTAEAGGPSAQTTGSVVPMPLPPASPPAPAARAPSAIRSKRSAVSALSLDALAGAIRSANASDEIGDLMVEWLSGRYECALVFVVKNENAMGWKGYAPNADHEMITSWMCPLTTPSMLQMAYERRAVFSGAPPEEGETLHVRLWRMLKCERPTGVATVPVILADRVVNIVYVHPHPGTALPEDTGPTLTQLAMAAQTGLLQILQAKRGGQS